MLDKLTCEMFAERLGESFIVEMPERTLEFQLIEVKSLGSPDGSEGWGSPGTEMREESFSIVFRGPLDILLDQGMVKISHEQMGTIDGLFLVPIAVDDRGRYYEAVFN